MAGPSTPTTSSSSSSWVLLDTRTYIADSENATSAWSKLSSGEAIRVTVCTAPPPLASFICVWCPDADDIVTEPTVEATEGDLVLLCVYFRGLCRPSNFFVYKATGSKGPSLRLLHDDICQPCLSQRHSMTFLAHSAVHPHVDVGDDDYIIAALNRDPGSRIGVFRLWIFDSKDEKWSTVPFSLDGIYCHITTKVIVLGGGGGLLGFVDPWRGIVVFDVLGRQAPSYVPLPSELIRLDEFDKDPWNYRDIAVVDGRLSVVDLSHTTEQGTDQDTLSWKVSSWSWPVSDHWDVDWRRDYAIDSRDIVIDRDTVNVHLLPSNTTQGSKGTHHPTFEDNIIVAHPTLSLSEDGVVYILGKTVYQDKQALVLSVDTRIPRLQDVAPFDASRMYTAAFAYSYTQSRISNYFNMIPDVKGKMKRRGTFNVRYPRKQDRRHLKHDQQNVTGSSKIMEDVDSMTLD